MNEYKFIITKDLRHFKSDILHHYDIAINNGYDFTDILESGLFIEGQIFILESQNRKHLLKHKGIYLGNILQDSQSEGEVLRLLASSWLRGRALESQLYYSKGIIREGD